MMWSYDILSSKLVIFTTTSRISWLKLSLLYNPMNNFLSISFLACYYTCFFLSRTSALSDNITPSQPLKDGETLVSAKGIYELGFFSPGMSKNRYLGIWFKNIPVKTYVWVANRENPIKDLSGSMIINSNGSLELLNGSNITVWSANPSTIVQSPAAQILDDGNLVLREINSNTYLWQSFDYPADTLLANMKLGWDLRTKFERRLTSWKSSDDPSQGPLSCAIELGTFPQLFIYKDNRKFFRGGPWNGLRFTGAPELRANSVFDFNFVSNGEEIYYTYELTSESVISTFVLNETTSTRDRYVWVEADKTWRLFASLPRDYCDTYGLCGPNGICKMSDSPVCQCLKGFEPKSAQSWNNTDWSGGCVRSEPLNCTQRHEFVKFSGLKLPDTDNSWVNASMSLKECEEMCMKNCSCTAYSNMDVRGRGSGCALWFDDLFDVRAFPLDGQDLYIRMPYSNQTKRSLVIIAIVGVPIALLCVLVPISCYMIYRRKTRPKATSGENEETGLAYVPQREDMDLPLLDLATIELATDGFSEDKKLGEGCFGPVYKGSLIDGKLMAVKRLSKSSGQGLEEFKNEVKLIARLQHRNLVKLLGCCIEGEEKILIYEYMPNGSLDSYIFDEAKRSELNWRKRFNIICGIARGLLYLHQDSRLRIIHRDLKAGNVLLDDDMNPKISDFGMARTFGGDQDRDNTRRIVGTYGYMAPEYAIYGLFSVKSDVFSFGVLLLEIVSGKKSRGFDNPQNLHNLIGYAWKLWTEGRQLDLIDSMLEATQHSLEITRCIHVGLLCIQQNPDDRPSMSSAVLMLNGESALPHPKQPGFLIDFIPNEALSSSSNDGTLFSVNDVTITTIDGR